MVRLPASGVILAGGTSRRMGREKLHLPWAGGTLLSHAVEVITSSLQEAVLVGYPRGGVPSAPRMVAVTDTQRIGPAGGLLLGLKAMTYPKAVVVAADMPFIDDEAIRTIWGLSRDSCVTILRTADGLHPLFGVYGKECIPALAAAVERGNHRVTGFWDGLAVRVIDVGNDASWNRTLLNINCLEDYRNACALASQHAAPDKGTGRPLSPLG